MRKIILSFILIVSILLSVGAQDYKTGIGLRGGISQGLTLKHFLNEKTVIEGLLQTHWGGFELTGLYEINNPRAFDVERLNWYYGFGAHLGSYEGKNVPWNTSGTVVGIDGIIGLEYNFSEAPINIGIDWKPVFNLMGDTNFRGDGGALSIRYIF
jgi:hypothetical protein